LLHWFARGPLSPDDSKRVREIVAARSQPGPDLAAEAGWRAVMADGVDPRVDLSAADAQEAAAVWLACSDVFVAEPTRAQFLASSNGTLQVWLNGRLIHERSKAGKFQPDSDRFEAQLDRGANRVIVDVAGSQGAAQFHVRFRRLSSSAEHERIAQFVLQNSGSTDRGRDLFTNAEKTLCVKCHRLNDRGGAIGPDLTGIGSRFSRIHLIESILEPSRSIAPSYETITVALTSGRVVTGVKVAETDRVLTLGDEQGTTHEILTTEIDERKTQSRSTMPEGLEKRFTDRDFLDLVTFLAAQKKTEPR
jgi:putative heme-binding domain-containing protein